MDKALEIKGYSKKELAKLYAVSRLTLKSWLKPFEEKIGPYTGKCYTPNQIKIIIDSIGEWS